MLLRSRGDHLVKRVLRAFVVTVGDHHQTPRQRSFRILGQHFQQAIPQAGQRAAGLQAHQRSLQLVTRIVPIRIPAGLIGHCANGNPVAQR